MAKVHIIKCARFNDRAVDCEIRSFFLGLRNAYQVYLGLCAVYKSKLCLIPFFTDYSV